MEDKGSGAGGVAKGGGAAGITGSAKNSVTPGFLGGAGGGEAPAGMSDKNKSGAEELGAAESAAAGANLEQKSDDLEGAREDEESAGGYYTGAGGEEEDDDGEKKNFFSGYKGPTAMIIGLIVFFGTMIFSTQMLQPFSLAERFLTAFNSMQTSAAARSNIFVRFQLDNGTMRTPYRQGQLFRGSFSMSSKQKNKLKQHGIELEEVGGKKVMVQQDGSGGRKIIAANDTDAESLRGLGLDDTNKIMTFKDAFEGDDDFFKAYKGASLTWRGAIANMFETGTLRFLTTNRLTRNLFQSYRDTGDDATNKANMSETLKNGIDEIKDGGVKNSGLHAEQDDRGNVRGGETEATGQGDGARNIKMSEIDSVEKVRGEIETIRQKYAKSDTGSGISGIAQATANYTCLAFNFLGGVSLLVSAAQTLQMVRVAMAFLETVDKVKAGDGDTAPINQMTAALNDPTGETYWDVEAKSNTDTAANMVNSASNVSANPTGAPAQNQTNITNANENLVDNYTIKQTHETNNAMSSSVLAPLYNAGKVDVNAPEVTAYNFTKNIKTIMWGLGVSMGAFTGCAIAKMVANGLGVAENIYTIVACIAGAAGAAFSFGATLIGCLPALGELASSIALSVGASLLIGGIIKVITPLVAGALMTNIVEHLGGKRLASVLKNGAHTVYQNIHRANGGSLGGVTKYLQFFNAQQGVIAEEARYDRLTKSPFDTSSQYTFMGNLARQLLTFTRANSVMSTVMSSASVLSNSIISLTPTASAYEASENIIEQYDEVCPYLDSIGAVGDEFCTPYAMTDISTMEENPVELVETVDGLDDEGNFLEELDENGNVQIKEGSDLAKYILFCDNRNSAFGIADQNIVNQVATFAQVTTDNQTFNNVTNSAIGAIPIVGDSIDVVTNAQSLANAGLVSGESCVAGNNVGQANGLTWDESKQYQRFIEDQALMESMGMIEESAVTGFLNKYEETHPIDNSYEGILARYSGLEKEDVVALLDIIEYGNYLANYDPTTRYAFGQDLKPAGVDELKFDNDNKVAYVVLLNTIEFADVRNRSFVV